MEIWEWCPENNNKKNTFLNWRRERVKYRCLNIYSMWNIFPKDYRFHVNQCTVWWMLADICSFSSWEWIPMTLALLSTPTEQRAHIKYHPFGQSHIMSCLLSSDEYLTVETKNVCLAYEIYIVSPSWAAQHWFSVCSSSSFSVSENNTIIASLPNLRGIIWLWLIGLITGC